MRIRRVKIHMNAAARKPVYEITDRAKRYRANSRENRPGPPKQCGFCGSRRRVEIHHVNGRESDGTPDNLMWACRRCNTSVGHALRRSGLGRLTRQYNPAKARGSRRSLMQAYGNAIKVMRGVFEGDVAAAVATIRATPPDVRSAYTSRSWPVRRQFYGPSGRQGSLFGGGKVPF